jgi:uncharacterized membrane-anchored protein YitT (DUF2179 family)
MYAITKKRNSEVFKNIRSYVFITIGLFLYTFAWSGFLIPSGILGGGISGVSTLIYYATGKTIQVGISNLILNAILILIAMKILGAKFGINTIYGIVISSLFFILLQNLIHDPIIKDNKFMCALIGAMLSGLGIGIAFSNGGNSGGTDIIALIITKYYNVSPGRVILYLDVLIIGSSYFVFTNLSPQERVEIIIYGYVIMGVFSYTLDTVIEGNKQSYQIMIFSKENRLIADRIGKEIKRGVTLLKGEGWYSKSEQNVLVIMARKQDKTEIIKIINESDNEAFFSIAKVSGVFGKNFDRVKI